MLASLSLDLDDLLSPTVSLLRLLRQEFSTCDVSVFTPVILWCTDHVEHATLFQGLILSFFFFL